MVKYKSMTVYRIIQIKVGHMEMVVSAAKSLATDILLKTTWWDYRETIVRERMVG